MKTFVKGICSVLILLGTLRMSFCATTFFNITSRPGGRVLGPFQANSVSGGIQTPFSIASGLGGGQSGRPAFSPITVEAPFAGDDLTLIQALVTGAITEQVDIGFYANGGGSPFLYRKLTLKGAIFPSYKSATDSDGPVTTFTILFSTYTDTTYQRSNSGAVGKTFTTTYDLVTERATSS